MRLTRSLPTLLVCAAITLGLGATSVAAGRALEGPLNEWLARQPDAAQMRKLDRDARLAPRADRQRGFTS